MAGFDNEKYVEMQTGRIRERISANGNKLYLEFGGKLFDDMHAARVLPGYDPNCKIKLMLAMRDITEIIMCVGAVAIEQNKIRADFGITYDEDAIRQIGNLREMGLEVSSVVITRYKEQSAADVFRRRLENMGCRVYLHRPTKGYPTELDTIISSEGYGANPYIETKRPLVLICGPGPGSGKLATALSQLYHENVRGNKAGYAKFETFPIWNLPLKHPINLAYEAATADLNDVNMIDPYHLEAYGRSTVNYNRDIEVFPIVRAILEKITGRSVYKSPTDMGVNMAGFAITNENACLEASRQEIIRRHFNALCDFKQGTACAEIPGRIEVIMRQIGLCPEDRLTVMPARAAAVSRKAPACAIGLPGGVIVTGKESPLMSAPCAAIINAVKTLAGIDDSVHLLSPDVLEPITGMKKSVLKSKVQRLGAGEMLIAMSICAPNDENVARAYEKLPSLSGCEAHSTVMLTPGDRDVLRKMGINLTCDPEYTGNEHFAV